MANVKDSALPVVTSVLETDILAPTVDPDGAGAATSRMSIANLFTGRTLAAIVAVGIRSSGAAFDLQINNTEVLTANRALTITLNNADRTLTVAGNATISGTNTGDQTSVTGNAGTATALQTARTINGTSFDGTANITVTVPIATGVSGLGTNVATALAVNVGTAGAFVVNGGAGGTPASLTLTNATGLPPTTGIVGWPANAAGVLTNDGAGVLSWGAGGSGATTALDNLAAVAINTALLLGISDAAALGSATKMWSDLFLADGAVINFNAGDVTLTHSSNALTVAGGTFAVATFTVSDTIIQTSSSATAFQSGPNGATNPVFRLVNNTASQGGGLSVNGLANGAGSLATPAGVSLTAIGAATQGLFINAAGGGMIGLVTPTGSVRISSDGAEMAGFYGAGIGARLGLVSAIALGWGATTNVPDTGLSRLSAAVVGVGTGAQGSFAGTAKAAGYIVGGANGETATIQSTSESVTLDTGAVFTDSVANLLPANSIILSVTARITTTIAGVDSTALQIGDPTTATRFGSGGTLTAGATIVGLNQLQGGVATDAAGPVQTAAAKVRLTLAGGADNTPSAGVVRVVATYITLVAPTS